MAGMDKAYLADLQRLLEAEQEMKAQGVDLLADPEYCAMREQFIDGAISLDQLADRIDALAASLPDDDDLDTEAGDQSLAELVDDDDVGVDDSTPDDDGLRH